MPTITFRVPTQADKDRVEADAKAAGQSVSEYVRDALDLSTGNGMLLGQVQNATLELEGRVVRVEQRLRALEQLAGDNL